MPTRLGICRLLNVLFSETQCEIILFRIRLNPVDWNETKFESVHLTLRHETALLTFDPWNLRLTLNFSSYFNFLLWGQTRHSPQLHSANFFLLFFPYPWPRNGAFQVSREFGPSPYNLDRKAWWIRIKTQLKQDFDNSSLSSKIMLCISTLVWVRAQVYKLTTK